VILQRGRNHALVIRELAVNQLGHQNDRAKGEAHLVRRQRNVQRIFVIEQQTVQFKHGLARQNHFLARQIGVDLDAGVGQTVTIGRDSTQFLAFNQQQQTVQVITHVLRCHRVLGLADQLAKGFLRNRELLGFAFIDRHAREIVGRQGLQAEPALATAYQQTLVFENQTDFGGIGQGAQDFLQLASAHSHCAIAITAGTFCTRGDLDLDVGGQQGQTITLLFQQHVGQDRQRMTTLDNSRNRLQRG